MSKSAREIADAAADSTVTGASMQSCVREALQEGCLETVVDAVTIYRRNIQSWIEEGALGIEDESATRRKVVNNIINDISRLARTYCDMSIVCTSRKDHTYEAVPPKPRSTPSDLGVTSPNDLWQNPVDKEAEREGILKDMCETSRTKVLNALFDAAHGEYDALGKEFLDMLRARRVAQ